MPPKSGLIKHALCEVTERPQSDNICTRDNHRHPSIITMGLARQKEKNIFYESVIENPL